MEKLLVYPANMQKNLDRLGGLIHSQRVLLALTQAGVSREDSYRLVQRNAMPVWRGEGDFLALLKADPEVAAALAPEQIEACFDLDYHFKHVDTISGGCSATAEHPARFLLGPATNTGQLSVTAPRIVYLNGQFLPFEEARVPIKDRGFLFADGIYESRDHRRQARRQRRAHLARLDRSLGENGIRNPHDAASWERLQTELVARNGVTEGLVYMQVTRAWPSATSPSRRPAPSPP